MSDVSQNPPIAKFGEVFDFKGGSQPPKSEFSSEPRDGYVRLLQIRDFDGDSKAVYIKDEKKWPKCSEQDIMIGRYGASVGKVLGGKAGAYNVALVRLIFDPQRVHPAWARHLCASQYFQGPLKNISRSAQNGFNKEDLAEIEFPFPKLCEQRQIAAHLDSLFKRSQNAREELRRIPRLVGRYKQSILFAAFAGSLTETWRKIRHFPEPHPATLDAMVETPIRNGLSVRGSDNPPGIRALRLSALRSGIVDLNDVRFLPISSAQARRFLLCDGDVLVSRGNGTKTFVGLAARVQALSAETIFPDTAFRIRLARDVARPEWFTAVWNAPQVRSQIESAAKTTAGIWKVSQADLARIKLKLPCIDEQDEIAHRIQVLFSRIEQISKDVSRATDLVDRMEQATLAKAFRGELLSPHSEYSQISAETLRS